MRGCKDAARNAMQKEGRVRGCKDAARNAMQKEGRVHGCKNVARNDMLKEEALLRLQGRLARWNAKDGGAHARTFPAVLRQCPLANADTRQISACHCEERSDVAIRISCGSTKRKAILWANPESTANSP